MGGLRGSARGRAGRVLRAHELEPGAGRGGGAGRRAAALLRVRGLPCGAERRPAELDAVLGQRAALLLPDRRRPRNRVPALIAVAQGAGARIAAAKVAADVALTHSRAVSWWQVLDVSDWPEVQWEQRGMRAKRWVTDPEGQLWLRKGIRGWDKVPGGSRPTEPAIESFTLELARRCGLPVAYGRAATWRTAAGIVRGFVSRKFQRDGETQWTGAELVPGADADSMRVRIGATLELIYRALAGLTGGGMDTLVPFVRIVMFDAWIGNGDRHLGNWAVLVAGRGKRFAPMFDTAGCLGAELLDGHGLFSEQVTDDEIVAYAHGCKSGYGDGVSRPGISQREVLEIARQWPEWKSVYHELFPRFASALTSDVGAMLDEVPDDWWPLARRRFARRLLVARAKILEGAVP